MNPSDPNKKEKREEVNDSLPKFLGWLYTKIYLHILQFGQLYKFPRKLSFDACIIYFSENETYAKIRISYSFFIKFISGN